MIKLLFELFIFYIVYKLIFELIIPVYNTTKSMKRKMEDINQQMQQDRANSTPENPVKSSSSNSSIKKEYIDFEEIK